LVAAADLSLITLKTNLPGAVPSKLYEAMASGKPIILSADGEAAEIVQEHKAGLAVKPGDRETLTKALRVLKAEPALRRRLGKNGRRAAELYFDRAKIAERFIDYLESEANHIASNSLP
jgi:glycosyltransferase involved in cell wall biosynthesis